MRVDRLARWIFLAAISITAAAPSLLAEPAARDNSSAAWTRDGRPLPRPEFLQPQLDERLPLYRPCSEQELQGVLEGSAPAILPQLVQRWTAAFQHLHPAVRVNLPPPYSGPQGSLSPTLRRFLDGGSQFALVSRDMTRADVMAYEQAHRVPPRPIPVVGGAWRHFGFVDAIAVVVNEANPLRALTLAQLDAVFSASRFRGHKQVRTWGDLGVPAWADKPVHVVGAAAWRGAEASARATFVQRQVLSIGQASGEWRDDIAAEGGEEDVPDQVAGDPYAIGFTGMGHLVSGIKTVALAQEPGGPAVDATYEDVALGRYPLSRVAYLVPSRAAGQPLDPALREFVRFILSREGQQIVLDQGVMLPLREPQAAAARLLLDDSGQPDGCKPRGNP